MVKHSEEPEQEHGTVDLTVQAAGAPALARCAEMCTARAGGLKYRSEVLSVTTFRVPASGWAAKEAWVESGGAASSVAVKRAPVPHRGRLLSASAAGTVLCLRRSQVPEKDE